MRLLPNRGKLLIVDAPRLLNSLPGAHWNSNYNGIEFSLTLDSLTRVREALGMTPQQIAPTVHPELMAWARAAKRSADEAAAALAKVGRGEFEPFAWRDNTNRDRTPFHHQQVMASFAYNVDGAAFFCEMRTGKTRAVLEAASAKISGGDLDCVLVICPARVMSVWDRETREWTNLTPVRLDQSIAERCRLLENAIANGMHRGKIFVTNYEALARMRDTILHLMDNVHIGFVLDEAHKVKNPQAQVTKSAIKVARKSPWRVALTGTPVTNTGCDLWSQMYTVDLGVTFGANFVAFKNEFFQENPWSHEVTMLPGAETEINRRLQRRALRYRQADCFDMPERLYDVMPITLTDQQRSAYNQMEEELLTIIAGTPWETDDQGELVTEVRDDSTSRAIIVLTQYLRLSQITSGFLPMDDGSVHQFDPNPKLDVLENEVRQLVEDGQPALVWAWYQMDIANIRRRLHDLNPVVIAGGMTARHAEQAEAAFQSGASPVLIGNPGSAGLGLKLTAATTAFYYSQNFNMEYREQSEARNYEPAREGRRVLNYFDLCVPRSIDEIILHRVRDKQSLAATLVEVRRPLGAPT